MIKAIHHIGINVRDLDRMIRFYHDAFGFELVGETFGWDADPKTDTLIDVNGSAARAAILRSASCVLDVFQYSAPAPEVVLPLRPHDRGYTHLCVEVTDIEQDMAHLQAAGMDFTDRQPVDMGVVKAIYGYDPEGNLIEILQAIPGSGMAMAELTGAGAD